MGEHLPLNHQEVEFSNEEMPIEMKIGFFDRVQKLKEANPDAQFEYAGLFYSNWDDPSLASQEKIEDLMDAHSQNDGGSARSVELFTPAGEPIGQVQHSSSFSEAAKALKDTVGLDVGFVLDSKWEDLGAYGEPEGLKLINATLFNQGGWSVPKEIEAFFDQNSTEWDVNP